MKRTIMDQLVEWAVQRIRKPLLLYGARQTGKTYILDELAKAAFPGDCVRFDLERDSRARQAFEPDLEPRNLIRRLAQASGRQIDPERTLLILDEIQSSNRALASLKYFCEDMPQLHVAAAGSLLGIAVNQQGFSMPVGKVHTLTLHPMSFDEFLDAVGDGELIAEISDCYDRAAPFYLHDAMLERFWQYLIVGGMPEAVSRFARNGSFSEVREVQAGITDLYVADMAKYATPVETARIRDTWNSIPAQLAKENHKFQYKLVRSGGRASVYSPAIAWLLTAGLVERCMRVSSGRLPLAMHEDVSSFKMYTSDTGLLAARAELDPAMVLDAERRRRWRQMASRCATGRAAIPPKWISSCRRVIPMPVCRLKSNHPTTPDHAVLRCTGINMRRMRLSGCRPRTSALTAEYAACRCTRLSAWGSDVASRLIAV